MAMAMRNAFERHWQIEPHRHAHEQAVASDKNAAISSTIWVRALLAPIRHARHPRWLAIDTASCGDDLAASVIMGARWFPWNRAWDLEAIHRGAGRHSPCASCWRTIPTARRAQSSGSAQCRRRA